MIFGHINNTEAHHYPAAVACAVDYLVRHDLRAMAAGRYQHDRTGWVVQVLDLQTVPHSESFPEAHRHVVDVQFLVHGEEQIGVATEKAELTVHQPYHAERDIIFYRDAPNETLLQMKPGNFAVFFPQDLHRPNLMIDSPRAIRKVVIKIPVTDVIHFGSTP
ncbi:YhcH/YjgK/YiaL family protein [Erwiniaceae bacterium CAU 1747]